MATISEILNGLVASERANDAHRLAPFLADDFRFIGPLGFVLTGEQFLGRFDGGRLTTSRFDLTDIDVREHGNVAAAIGAWTQETTFQGTPNNGTFRFSGVFTRDGDGWRLFHAQLSPTAPPPAQHR